MGLTRQELRDLINTGQVVQLIGDTDNQINIEFAIYRDQNNGRNYFMSNNERYSHLCRDFDKIVRQSPRFKYWAAVDNSVQSITWTFQNIRKLQDVTLFELI